MGANQRQSKTLALEPVEGSSSAGELLRPAAPESRGEGKQQRELRMTTVDEFLATAAREYEAGTVDRALWRRAVDQCRNDPSLVVAAYLRARATELESRSKPDDRSSAAEAGARVQTNRHEPDAPTSAPITSTFLPNAPSQKAKRKLAWAAAAVGALACVVAIIYAMVLPAPRDQGQAQAVAAAASTSSRPAGPGRERTVSRNATSEVNPDRTKPALAATVQQLRNDGNWNVLVLYAAEWTRQEPDNALAWRELSGGYSRLRQYNDALDAANKAVQLAPSDALAWRNLGQINLTVDRLPEAGMAFDKALALSPDDADALCGAASVAQRQSRPKAAEPSTSRGASVAAGCPGADTNEVTVAPAGVSSARKVVSSGSR